MERLAFGFLLFLVICACIAEFRRWVSADYRLSLTDSQRSRRIIGSLLLLVVVGMAYGATWFPPPYVLSRLLQAFAMLYWGVCLLLGIAIIVVAYSEAKETYLLMIAERRRNSKELMERALQAKDDDPR